MNTVEQNIVNNEVRCNISSLIPLFNSDVQEEILEETNPDGVYFTEIFEYWIVSSWLGSKLKSKGEIVFDIGWNTIWGRQTTGQAIYMDGVIEEIAGDLQ